MNKPFLKDNKGMPLIFYHGTDNNIDEFYDSLN